KEVKPLKKQTKPKSYPSQETLAQSRSTFSIVRIKTRYDRVPDCWGAQSGSSILAFRSTTINDCDVLMDCFIFRWIPLKERKPPSAVTNFRCRKQGRHEESPSKRGFCRKLLPPYLLPPSAVTNFRCRKQGRHEESPSKRGFRQKLLPPYLLMQPETAILVIEISFCSSEYEVCRKC
nr:hypothetical protein [Tanacetum cinerariifolium]